MNNNSEQDLHYVISNYETLAREGCLEERWIRAYLHAGHFKNISFRSMGIFNVIFINFILVSIIIFGFERQNNVISFILTLVAFNYLLDFAGRMKSKFLIN